MRFSKARASDMLDHLFSAIAFFAGEHWKLSGAQSADMAEAVVETQGIIPAPVFSAVDRLAGPVHLFSAFAANIIPRVAITKAMQGMSEQQKQAEAASKVREKKMQAAGFGGADVRPGNDDILNNTARAQAGPGWGVGGIPPVDESLYGNPPIPDMQVDPHTGQAVIRIPTIGVT